MVVRYLDVGRDMLVSLQHGAKCPCGYCHISDVESHKQDDHMESFFLAETVKYLWLLFDLAVDSDNIVESGPYKYIFSTEGHFLPATPEISLANEHCSYIGAFCKGDERGSYGILSNTPDRKDRNGTHKVEFDASLVTKSHDLVGKRGFIKGDCVGLTHAQKFGISYFEEKEDQSSVESKEGRTELDEKIEMGDEKVENENPDELSDSEMREEENKEFLKLSQFVIKEDKKNVNQEAQTIHNDD